MDGTNATTNDTQQASAPSSTASSQATSAPSSSQTPSNGATAGTSSSVPPYRPARKTIVIKREDGIKLEVAEDDDGADTPSSSDPSSHRQLGIDLRTLKHIDGKPTMEMNGKTCYISAIDPADPQQRTSQNTINLSGLVYQFTPVDPVESATETDKEAQQNEEDEDMEEEMPEPLPPNPCPPLTLPD